MFFCSEFRELRLLFDLAAKKTSEFFPAEFSLWEFSPQISSRNFSLAYLPRFFQEFFPFNFPLGFQGAKEQNELTFSCSRGDGDSAHSYSDPPPCQDKVLASLRRQESCRIKRSFSAARHVAQRWEEAATGRAADLSCDGERRR